MANLASHIDPPLAWRPIGVRDVAALRRQRGERGPTAAAHIGATHPAHDDSAVDSDIIGDVVRTIVQLREAQAAALERAARRRGISKAAVVREALDALLTPEETGADEALKRALAAAGTFASGVPDLAERHDDYLTRT